MSQIAPRVCSQCHSSIEGDARFCPNCGAVQDLTGASLSSAQTSRADDIYATHEDAQTMLPPPPPPTFPKPSVGNQPYAGNPPHTQYNSGPNYSPSSPDAPTYASLPSSSPNNQLMQNQQRGSFPVQQAPFVPVPAYAQAPKRKRRGGLIFVLLLLILVIIGSVFFFRTRNQNQNQTGNNNTPVPTQTAITNTTTTPTGTTPVTSGAQGSTTPLSGTVTYSGIQLTFSSAQLASTFADDTSLSADKPGVLRVNFKENNATTGGAYYGYNDVLRLVLPDGTIVTPVNEKHPSPPNSQSNQINWSDFQVPQNLDVSKTVLRLGTQSEAQMNIPLVQNTDLSKYQDKTVMPGGTSSYAGIKWTLTQAVRSWSSNDKQVTSGNRYVTVTLSVDNPSANTVYFDPSSVLRLQTGTTKVSPESGYTLPTSFASGTTNQSGTVTFTMPEGSTSYSLIFQAQDTSPQSSINFQIP